MLPSAVAAIMSRKAMVSLVPMESGKLREISRRQPRAVPSPPSVILWETTM